MKTVEDKLIIKPVDSLNLVWSEDCYERLLFNSLLHKYCSKGHWVHQNDFYRDTSRSDNLSRICKSCSRAHNSHQRMRQQHKAVLLDQQDYLCAICDKDLKSVTNPNFIQIDHNHDTGELRGVLCHLCNNGLGKFKDNINLLGRAKKYLKSYE